MCPVLKNMTWTVQPYSTTRCFKFSTLVKPSVPSPPSPLFLTRKNIKNRCRALLAKGIMERTCSLSRMCGGPESRLPDLRQFPDDLEVLSIAPLKVIFGWCSTNDQRSAHVGLLRLQIPGLNTGSEQAWHWQGVNLEPCSFSSDIQILIYI